MNTIMLFLQSFLCFKIILQLNAGKENPIGSFTIKSYDSMWLIRFYRWSSYNIRKLFIFICNPIYRIIGIIGKNNSLVRTHDRHNFRRYGRHSEGH